jgi:hypothetical protein
MSRQDGPSIKSTMAMSGLPMLRCTTCMQLRLLSHPIGKVMDDARRQIS